MCRAGKLGRCRDVGDVSGARNVINSRRADIGGDGVGHAQQMIFAPLHVPGQRADQAFQAKVTKCRATRQGSEVWVREMCDAEHGASMQRCVTAGEDEFGQLFVSRLVDVDGGFGKGHEHRLGHKAELAGDHGESLIEGETAQNKL